MDAVRDRVLVVDDDPDLLALIEMRLGSAGYEVLLAASAAEGLATFRAERPQVVVTDLRMDGMDGHAFFARLHAEAPGVPVIMLTAHGTIPDAVSATQQGMFSFLTKPFDGRELIARVAEAAALSPRVDAGEPDAGWRRDIVSTSMVMDEVLRTAKRFADEDGPVLITGPRGSGKALLAQAMHAAGAACGKPFHAVSGHGAGAPGQPANLAGAIAAAEKAGGTVFVGDVDALSPADQALLLRSVGTLGPFGQRERRYRVMAATAQQLETAVRDGLFRADLYYGLASRTLAVPGLEQRREDIPLLIAHFTQRCLASGPVAAGFSPEAMALLLESAWPGNVRQLRNVVEQALTQVVTPLVPASALRRIVQQHNEREAPAFDEARREFERDYLVRLLDDTRGNVTQAARIAQRNRTEFYKLLAKHELDPASFKAR